jgi:peptide/nickel transport system permease protein
MAGLILVAALAVCAIFAPLLAPSDPALQHTDGLTMEGDPIAPAHAYLLGTDALGRDELSRLLYGARISLAIAVGANLLAGALGILVGGVAGLAGPRMQTLLMRLVDVLISFPVLLLAITVLAVVQASNVVLVLLIGISWGAYLARIVFAQVVSIRQREFVVAAIASGVRSHHVLVRHIVPHVIPAALVYCTFGVATAIQVEAALSYIGVGIRPPTASWGNMLADGQSYLFSAPWLVALPGAAIVITLIGFTLLGDGLRDALDPTLERRGRILVGGLR